MKIEVQNINEPSIQSWNQISKRHQKEIVEQVKRRIGREDWNWKRQVPPTKNPSNVIINRWVKMQRWVNSVDKKVWIAWAPR